MYVYKATEDVKKPVPVYGGLTACQTLDFLRLLEPKFTKTLLISSLPTSFYSLFLFFDGFVSYVKNYGVRVSERESKLMWILQFKGEWLEWVFSILNGVVLLR